MFAITFSILLHLCPVARTCLQPVKFLLIGKLFQDTLVIHLVLLYLNAFTLLIIFLCFTGTARLPEASENPLLLKQVVRKPLEAVLRYLGIKTKQHQTQKNPTKQKTLLTNSANHFFSHFVLDLDAVSGLKKKT